ncbi:DUF3592 domain-containing protein [Reticulibacter mediterranei]|uniref:DUF3592 domain-containing protein n=1 Tax=Reticulibacter mediterranei TaxID=2778369 RepID=UPI001C68D718|nr:DUF3592 domain-containing protein [Reticulibacter mediterranei]
MFNSIVRRRVSNNPITNGCLLAIFGLVFLGVGYFLLMDTLKFLPGTLSAQGVITNCSYDRDRNGSSSGCRPTIRFQTQSGQSISVAPSESSSFFHVRDTIAVRYHPETPEDGRTDTFLSTWMLPLICTGVGLITFLVSPFVLLRGIIRRAMGLFVL